ncbi:hypothetical protein CWB41_11440 [Methylovirgula ligni]|uniref:Uncharacterized protein n=2 Tax=Methylovirgula ligni TaxID=569860 RepID=A0A3D9YTW1_9HYPH|nr:hypothetical protein [Methylovirgula ligni]QAY96267.1 hypothetical protein CWB41_11440 [Methylovirgula ligni]REF86026.1 hypothetical protein DES32_2069 [Methylovirgula ligni]
MPADVTLTTRRPEPPSADFAFEIDFKRGEGSASRVFLAINDFIKGCERLDAELVGTIDSNIETVMVLEDIEAGSIKVWLRNLLSAVDDDALKQVDWKPAVGRYLVKAKYAVIKWVDDDTDPKSLPALAREIQSIAAETDVKHLPDYRAPSVTALLGAVKDFEEVKSRLLPDDRATFIGADGQSTDFNLSIRWDLDRIEELAIKEVVRFPVAPMILAVKKPDYLGNSKWELRHGKRSISAKIEDAEWLRRFQNRNVDVRPGDALRCEVQIEHLYGHDNELLAENYTIVHVIDVLVNAYRQENLFEDHGNGS